jgi:hypothetical protein
MYLYLAMIWLIIGVVVQVFWTTLAPRMRIPVDRTVMGGICLFLVCYCLLRWWMARMLTTTKHQEREPPSKPRAFEYHPDLDFSKLDEPKPPDETGPPG